MNIKNDEKYTNEQKNKKTKKEMKVEIRKKGFFPMTRQN